MDHLSMKNLLAFFFGWLIAAVFMIPHARASVTVTPVISGYARNAVTGGYLNNRTGQMQRLLDMATMKYDATGNVSVGGKPLSIPAKVPLASNAAALVRAGLRATPMGLLTTAALGYLASNGITQDQQGNPVKETAPAGSMLVGEVYPSNWPAGVCSAPLGSSASYRTASGGTETRIRQVGSPADGFSQVDFCWDGSGSWAKVVPDRCTYVAPPSYDCAAPSYSTPTAEDYDALPDPIPELGPELADAPSYMPNGAPVGNPDFTSGRYSVGAPYVAGDGSTKQTVATVTNNTSTVTITTNETTIVDASGNPVSNPPLEPTETELSECEKHPETIGCAEFGTADPVEVPTTEIPVNPTVTPIGGPGQCPADVVTPVFGITWSYQPVCDFAADIRPLIIGFAWLAFAYIVAGTIRT